MDIKIENNLDYASQCNNQNQFKKAEEEYLKIIKETKNTTAIFRLANLYIKLSRYDLARELLNSYSFTNVVINVNKKTILAKLDIYEYNFERAFNLCNYSLKKTNGNNVFAQYNKAVALLNLGEYSTAQEIFKKLIKTNNFVENSYVYLIRIEMLKENYKNALVLANSYIPTTHVMKKKMNYLKYHLSKILNIEYIIPVDNYSINIDKSEDYEKLISHINKHFKTDDQSESLEFKDNNRYKFINEIEKQKKLYYYSIGKSSNYSIVELPYTKIAGFKNKAHAKIHTSLDENILTVYPIIVSTEFDQEGYGRIK